MTRFLLLFLALTCSVFSQDSWKTREDSYKGRVVVIKIGEEDLLSKPRFAFMTRMVQRASDEGAEAVVFDIDTPGGIAWDTTTLTMTPFQSAKCKLFAYVNPRAISAGALIACATDAIYMAPASAIGAAAVVNSSGDSLGEAERAKYDSAFKAMARTAAQSKGHNGDVVDGFVDINKEIIINGTIIKAKGEILTLDAKQATAIYNGKPLLAKGIAKSLDELRERENLKGQVIEAVPTSFEWLADLITRWAPLLLIIGIAGAYLEMNAPGFGLPGFVSLAAFSTFFFGHYVAGQLIGFEPIAVFIIGLALILLEVFLLPGTLIPGVLGVALVLGSLIYTMSGPISVPADAPSPGFSHYAESFNRLFIGLFGAIAVILVALRFLPKSTAFRRMTLQTSLGDPASLAREVRESTGMSLVPVDSIGVTQTPLRPSGQAEFNGRIIDVVTEANFIAAGQTIYVLESTPFRTLVAEKPVRDGN